MINDFEKYLQWGIHHPESILFILLLSLFVYGRIRMELPEPSKGAGIVSTVSAFAVGWVTTAILMWIQGG